MITPNEIRSKKFNTVESDGYDRNEVNELLVEVIESYEAVCTENKELYRKMEILANKIEEYREDEDSIKTALISAQKMASHVTNEAKTRADQTVKDSEAEAEKIVNAANENADKIVSEAREYVANLTKEKQEAADAIVEDAEAKANTAISSAQIVAQDTINKAKELTAQIVSEAKAEKDAYELITSKLKAEANDFKTTLVSLYEAELGKVKGLTKSDEDAKDVASLQAELDEIVDNINSLAAEEVELEEIAIDEPVAEEEPATDVADEPKEEMVYEDIFTKSLPEEEDEEPAQIDVIEEEDEVDEIINELDEIEPAYDDIEEIEEELPPTPEEIASALNAFSDNHITPVEGTGATIPVIEEEPELEFEKFFNIDRSQERTKETISLTPPEDDEDEEETKFRGFFKKKK